MPYELKVHANYPLLQITLGDRLEPGELRTLIGEIYRVLSELDYPVYNLVDALENHVDLGGILEGVSLAVRGNTPALLHPNLIETVVVTTDPLTLTALKGLNAPTFGNVQIKTFAAVDDAFVYINGQIATRMK